MADPNLAEPLSVLARLPWWAGVLSAGAAYAVLHLLATLPVPPAEAGAAADALVSLLRSGAAVAQYLVPGLLLVLAAASAVLAWRPGAAAGERIPPTLDWTADDLGQRGRDRTDPDREALAAAAGLNALIRAEERKTLGQAPAAPAVRHCSEHGPARAWRPRPRQVLDGIGMLGACGVALATWHWFASLPATPVDSPLGRLHAPLPTLETADGEGTPDPARWERPLGELQFGPAKSLPADPALAAPAAPEPEPEPAPRPPADPRSLEAAFDAAYIPPPECSGWHQDVDIVRCGNHRMRSLRAYLESGGRMPETERLRAPADWRQEQALREAREAGEAFPPIPAEEDQPIVWGAPPRPDSAEPVPLPTIRSTPLPPLTWRQEQALREAELRRRASEGLSVRPEDAVREGNWRDDWLAIPGTTPAPETSPGWR